MVSRRSVTFIRTATPERCQFNIWQELYEPLWDELYQRLKSKGIKIRGIWIADVAHQGKSGVINEQKLGDDRKC